MVRRRRHAAFVATTLVSDALAKCSRRRGPRAVQAVQACTSSPEAARRLAAAAVAHTDRAPRGRCCSVHSRRNVVTGAVIRGRAQRAHRCRQHLKPAAHCAGASLRTDTALAAHKQPFALAPRAALQGRSPDAAVPSPPPPAPAHPHPFSPPPNAPPAHPPSCACAQRRPPSAPHAHARALQRRCRAVQAGAPVTSPPHTCVT